MAQIWCCYATLEAFYVRISGLAYHIYKYTTNCLKFKNPIYSKKELATVTRAYKRWLKGKEVNKNCDACDHRFICFTVRWEPSE